MEQPGQIVVAGDVMPGRKVAASIARIGMMAAAARVRSVLGEGVCIGNLECPLSDRPPDRGAKDDGGPNLHAPTAAAGLLADAGFGLLSLANNHAMDCGAQGLASTLAALRDAGIGVVGAGRNLTEALTPAWLDVAGLRVAVVAFGNGQAATERSAGVAPFTTAALRRGIDATRGSDLCLVLVHTGLEFLPHPETWTRRFCREALRLGAHVVIGGHSHCIRGIQRHRHGAVAYGLGDFMMDTADPEHLRPHLTRTALTRLGFGVADPLTCRQGLVAEVAPQRGGADVRLRPVVVDDDFLPRQPRSYERLAIELTVERLSEQIARRGGESARLLGHIERAYRREFGDGGLLRRAMRLRPRHISMLIQRLGGAA
jgi:poly-gamma-glutamate synthesis protein (capsule biosynthesis protein)